MVVFLGNPGNVEMVTCVRKGGAGVKCLEKCCGHSWKVGGSGNDFITFALFITYCSLYKNIYNVVTTLHPQLATCPAPGAGSNMQ